VNTLRTSWTIRALVATLPVALDALCREPFLRALWRDGDFESRSVYLASCAATVALWFVLLGTRAWPARACIAALAWFALGPQAFTFARYRSYLDAEAILVGTTFVPSYADLRYAGARTIWAFVPIVSALVAQQLLGRSTSKLAAVRHARAIDMASLLAVVMAYLSPTRGVRLGRTPEALALASYGQLTRALWDKNETVLRIHPAGRSPIPVPKLVATQPKRNVLVVLNESVRASSTCTAYDPNCKLTPFSH
jgi:hypothetical protein